MKKTSFVLIFVAALIGVAAFSAGCGPKALVVGATPVPHAEILEAIKPLLKKEGVELKIVEYTDYVTPNLELQDKQLDANFFQHIPYLEDFNNTKKTDLVWVAKVHIEPMGIYSKKIKSLSELSSGSQVGIPNDVTNGGRALALLERAGLIKLKPGLGVKATVHDVAENPKELKLVELEAAMLPKTLPDLSIAVINGNFALQAGLNPVKDAIYLEGSDSPFANVLVVRKGDEKNPAILKLSKALSSPEVKKFIEEKYKGAIVPAF